MESEVDGNMKNSKQFWDKAAVNYDQAEEKDWHVYEKAIRKTKLHLKKNDVVMDYGCGTGLVSINIADSVKMIHAVDISSKMIELANQKADERGIENINYTCTTLFDERYKEGSFDIILAFYILHLSEDVHKVMERINKLLAPGGLIISATPCMKEVKLYRSLLYLGGKIGLIPQMKAYQISQLKDLMTEAKFEIIETECLRRSTHEYFVVARKL